VLLDLGSSLRDDDLEDPKGLGFQDSSEMLKFQNDIKEIQRVIKTLAK
jgi:hypothetical protein